MTGEDIVPQWNIGGDFYCSSGMYRREGGVCKVSCSGYKDLPHNPHCRCCHRKWPTPEQFEEEYDSIVPDDFPVWFIIPEDRNDNFHDWTLMVYAEALQYEHEEEEADFVPDMYIVCACTPFGKPADDWRPK